jgi:hypothetical protein
MAHGHLDPKDFGVEMKREEFVDLMREQFREFLREAGTLDVSRANALRFCRDVRSRHGWLDLPDDIILQAIDAAQKD